VTKSTPGAVDDLSDPRYGSHLVPLVRHLAHTDGAVLELGVGHWSTPLLRRYCKAADRKLVSLEADPAWARQFGLEAVSYDEAVPRLARQSWSIVLVDHWPETRRARDALAFVGAAGHILVHDHGILQRKGICPKVPPGWQSYVMAETLVMRGPSA
jgi:hypothetical protein